MSASSREILLLSLPVDPALARLIRLATRHFLRQNGCPERSSRESARQVEGLCRRLLERARRRMARRATRDPGPPPCVLRLVANHRILEVTARLADRGRPRRLLRRRRPLPA